MTSESKMTQWLELVDTTQPIFDLVGLGGYAEYANWKAHGRRVFEPDSEIFMAFIKSGPRDIKAVQKMAKRCNLRGIIAFNTEKAGYGVLLRTDEKNRVFPLGSEAAYEHLGAVFRQTNFGTTPIGAEIAIEKIIDTASTTTKDFINRGVFSDHYLENRLLAELEQTIRDRAEALRSSVGNVESTMRALGWSQNTNSTDTGSVCVIVSEEPDLGMARRSGEVAPSYRAVTELAEHAWVILTNGKSWRLYTDRASASTTTYFEINLESEPSLSQLLYLAGIFSKDSYDGTEPLVLRTYDGSQKYARKLEDDLAKELLRGGVFLNIVKGLLDHDMTTSYTDERLGDTKNTALKVLYRILFVLYAEAREMLPVRDKDYRDISIDALRSKLDAFEMDGDDDGCWKYLLNLFSGIREGNAKHNLPQYNGELFAFKSYIDRAQVRNKFIVPALRGLLERDGESADYAILEVRHLGSIYERLLEFSISQAEADILVREDSKGVHIVESKEHFKYKKNDLYLASKEGMVGRKSTASYYTPREIVQFLVKQGLSSILEKREEYVAQDMEVYRKRMNDDGLREKCANHLMDIQILDPAMGSGHFLVEALNQITTWATGMLTRYPDHPLWDEIRQDRNRILAEQKSRNVRIDSGLLTPAVLLKRRIMKQCIFGVDVNPLAVELAKVSLWLDSFAIGTPLTYMGHHVKCGDSTVGMWLGNQRYRDSTMDDFESEFGLTSHIKNVSACPDLTVEQVRRSQSEYAAHEDETRPRKNKQDVLAAQMMKPKKTALNRANALAQMVADRWNDKSADIASMVSYTEELRGKHRFFHWDLEMTDAFTDERRGFDLIVGNFPWDRVAPNDDEFFQKFDQEFKSLKPNTKKQRRKREILKRNPSIKKTHDEYLKKLKELRDFYSRMYEMQGKGDKDLWQLVMERCFDLCVPDAGVISVIIPSVLLNNGGCAKMRRHILDENRIISLYVYENRGIFSNVDSRYRFALLTMQAGGRTEGFPAGFYLHDTASLKDNAREADKFGSVSARDARDSTPEQYIVPELTGMMGWNIYTRLHRLEQTLATGHQGWDVVLSSGFHTTADAKHLNTKRSAGFSYWPVIKGESIHQFMPDFRAPPFVANSSGGLAVENNKGLYGKEAAAIYGMYRLAFRNQASDTNARTAIAVIIPPNTFNIHSMSFLVFSRNGRRVWEGNELDPYHQEISYLVAILNSMTFDFLVRAKTLTNTPIYVRTTPLPDPTNHDNAMAELAARLSVNGKPEFQQFADSMGIPNTLPKPGERIEMAAKLDALTACAYGLDSAEYQSVLDSFKFDEDSLMAERETVDWQASRAKPMTQFFGEVRKRTMDYFMEAEA